MAFLSKLNSSFFVIYTLDNYLSAYKVHEGILNTGIPAFSIFFALKRERGNEDSDFSKTWEGSIEQNFLRTAGEAKEKL